MNGARSDAPTVKKAPRHSIGSRYHRGRFGTQHAYASSSCKKKHTSR